MGIASTRRGWRRLRQAAKNRDGWRCQDCGKAGILEVHHIIPLNDGGEDFLDNLKTLCLDCHHAIHTNKPVERQAWDQVVKELYDGNSETEQAFHSPGPER